MVTVDFFGSIRNLPVFFLFLRISTSTSSSVSWKVICSRTGGQLSLTSMYLCNLSIATFRESRTWRIQQWAFAGEEWSELNDDRLKDEDDTVMSHTNGLHVVSSLRLLRPIFSASLSRFSAGLAFASQRTIVRTQQSIQLPWSRGNFIHAQGTRRPLFVASLPQAVAT